MEAFGRHLVIEPYLATVVLGGGLVAGLGSAVERRAILPAVAEGKCRLAVAHEDRSSPARAQRRSDGYLLQGEKKVVLGGPMADTLLVSAELAPGKIGVFVLPKDARGLTVRSLRMIDGSRAADVALADVAVPSSALLGSNEEAGIAIEAVLQRAIAARSADAVGAIDVMVKATIEYAKTCVQFGQPIANFQALQHRLVALKVKEERRGRRWHPEPRWPADAARAISAPRPRSVAAHALSIRTRSSARRDRHHQRIVARRLRQRLIAYEILLGSTQEHLKRYGAIIANPQIAAQGHRIAAKS